MECTQCGLHPEEILASKDPEPWCPKGGAVVAVAVATTAHVVRTARDGDMDDITREAEAGAGAKITAAGTTTTTIMTMTMTTATDERAEAKIGVGKGAGSGATTGAKQGPGEGARVILNTRGTRTDCMFVDITQDMEPGQAS